ncbi:MAG: ParB/RepB/Spo0J family partition protein [Hydrogenophaga sp.]|nr:ParB/RepB/Spo0J family partition protein [Hydrogenophaga sp.]
MSDDENNLDASATSAAADTETLIGRQVRISLEATDAMSGSPHMWAGKYGEITAQTPLGAYTVSIGGKKTKVFDLNDLELIAKPEAGQAAADPAPAQVAASAHHTELVEVGPLQAINSPTNPRRRRGLDMDSINALAASIRAQGIAQPILVRPLPASRIAETSHLDPRPAYEIIAGERRWRAAQVAELMVMPMLVRHLDDAAVLEIQLVENIEREDLDPMEEAEGFALLRERLGYTVDQIADRIGRGKGASYVRKTMKLLDLTPESREAMYEGHLGRSTGLLVARYPADRQAAVVDYIKSQAVARKGADAEPAPFRDIAKALYTRFNTVLAQAVFDIEDASLVPEAGACSGCPKRTSTAQDLFGDAEHATDSCTDEGCFAAKKAAHVAVVRSKAKAEGLKVLSEEEASAARPSPHSKLLTGYTRVDDVARVVTGDDGKEREETFADALRGMGRKAPKPVVLIDPYTCEAVHVIPDSLADKLLPPDDEEHPADKSARPPHAVDTCPPEEKAWREGGVRTAALFTAFDLIRTGQRNEDELRRTALALLADPLESEELPRLEGYMGWTEEFRDAPDVWVVARDKVMAMDADALGQLIAMASLELVLTTYPHIEDATAVLSTYGIDLLAVRDKVAEDLARDTGNESTIGDVA